MEAALPRHTLARAFAGYLYSNSCETDLKQPVSSLEYFSRLIICSLISDDAPETPTGDEYVTRSRVRTTHTSPCQVPWRWRELWARPA